MPRAGSWLLASALMVPEFATANGGAGAPGLVFAQPGATATLNNDVTGGLYGGAGVVGSGLTLTINGHVSGGLDAEGTFAGPSFVLGNGTNRLTFGPDAQVTGVISNSGALELSVPDGRLKLGGLGDGVISGTGSVRLRQGIIEFAGLANHTGGTTIDNGATLVLSGWPFIGRNLYPFGQRATELSGDVLNNGKLIFGSAPQHYGGVISGTGSVEFSTGRTVLLTGANTYSGDSIILRGSVALAGSGSLGNGAGRVTMAYLTQLDISETTTEAGRRINSLEGEGTVRLGSTSLTLGSAGGNSVFAGRITGMPACCGPQSAGGGLTIAGGRTILTGPNDYAGTTRILAGATLQIGDGGTTGTLGTGTPASQATGMPAPPGPGAVVNNGTLAFNRAGTLTVGNVISGTGRLVQDGPGNLILTASNTYTGPTVVNGGLLSVNGSIASSSAVILNGGTLGGAGTLPSLILPAGSVLAPGNSIGTIRVNGDLTLASGSTTSIEVQGAIADQIQVTGRASLGGRLQLVPLGGRYSFGVPYTILQAASVTGQFATIDTEGSFGAGVVPEVAVSATDVRLTLTPTLLTVAIAALQEGGGAASSRNIRATAGALDSAGRAGADLSPFFNVYNQPAAGISQAINQLSGEVATAATAMGFTAGEQFLATLLDPLGWGREAILGGRLRPEDDVRRGKRHAVWGAAMGAYNRTAGDAGDGSSARTTRSAGFVLGLDVRHGREGLAGLAIAVGEGQASLANGQGQSRGNHGQIGLHGSTRWGSVTLAAAGAFTFMDIDTRRVIHALGDDRQAGSAAARVYSLRAEARQDGVAGAGLRLLPVAALQFQAFDSQGYTERSAASGSAHGLSVAAGANASLRTELGAQAQGEALLGGRRVQGVARAAWAHYLQRDAAMNVSFAALPDAAFTVRGARPDANAALLSLGAEAELVAGVTLGARLDGEFSGNVRQVAGTARLRYLF